MIFQKTLTLGDSILQDSLSPDAESLSHHHYVSKRTEEPYM